ncbi:MAG: polysaccharide deacetylase family protein [Pirellulaceae bacterium]
MSKPLASLSLDLDNLWAYLKTHGDAEWESFPSYLDVAVPRILEFLEQRQTKITFFVVGQDAAIESNHVVLKSIADAGHEIANHSFNHEPWLHLYRNDELVEEFERSEQAILEATGQVTRGFRGPGFSCSDEVLNLLAHRGYQYDASTFPTFLGPVARAYYFLHSRFTSKQKEDRKELFGKFRDGFQPNKPFAWQMGERQLLEIPVTTMPIFRLPIHASYVFYLAGFSRWLAKTYLRIALGLCRLTGTRPSFLLHPLDFMDVKDAPQMEFFPTMKLASERKVRLLGECLDMMEKHWKLVTMGEHAEAGLANSPRSRPVPVTEFAEVASPAAIAATSDLVDSRVPVESP